MAAIHITPSEIVLLKPQAFDLVATQKLYGITVQLPYSDQMVVAETVTKKALLAAFVALGDAGSLDYQYLETNNGPDVYAHAHEGSADWPQNSLEKQLQLLAEKLFDEDFSNKPWVMVSSWFGDSDPRPWEAAIDKLFQGLTKRGLLDPQNGVTAIPPKVEGWLDEYDVDAVNQSLLKADYLDEYVVIQEQIHRVIEVMKREYPS